MMSTWMLIAVMTQWVVVMTQAALSITDATVTSLSLASMNGGQTWVHSPDLHDGVKAWHDGDFTYVNVPAEMIHIDYWQGPQFIGDGHMVYLDTPDAGYAYIWGDNRHGGFPSLAWDSLGAELLSETFTCSAGGCNDLSVWKVWVPAGSRLTVSTSTTWVGGVGFQAAAALSITDATVTSLSLTSMNGQAFVHSPDLHDGVEAWHDRSYTYVNVPAEMIHIDCFQGPHNFAHGDVVYLDTPDAGYAYIWGENTHNNRHGGLPSLAWDSLGAELLSETFAWVSSDNALIGLSVWKVWVPAGSRLTVPISSTWVGGVGFQAALSITDATVTSLSLTSRNGQAFVHSPDLHDGVEAWHDRGYTYVNVPAEMIHIDYFQGPHNFAHGDVVYLDTPDAGYAYIWGENTHNNRHGGLPSLAWDSLGAELLSETFTCNAEVNDLSVWKVWVPAGSRLTVSITSTTWVGGVGFQAITTSTDSETTTETTTVSRTSTESTTTTACEQGYHSRPGEECLPFLQHAVDVSDPDLATDAVAFDDADGGADEHQVTFTLTLGALPGEIYEAGLSIEYRFDIKETVEALSHESGCNAGFTMSAPTDTEAVKTLTYDELSGSSGCHFLTDSTDSQIIRSGYIGVFIVVIEDNAVLRWERMWNFPVRLTFDAVLTLHNDMDAMSRVKALFGDRPKDFALGDFESTLAVTAPNPGPTYAFGETVQVTHSLDRTSSSLDLEVVGAFLSNDAGATVYRDLTHAILPQTSDVSEVIFTFSAGRCDDPCTLVVISKVVHQAARRLGVRRLDQNLALHAVQAIHVKMPTVEPEAMQVSLAMVVQGIDYNALMTRPSLQERFIGAIKSNVLDRVGDRVGADDILVTLSPGSVRADVAIRAHPDIDILSVKTTLEDPTVQSSMKEDVAQTVAAMEGVHLVSNGPISTELSFVGIVEVAPEGSLQRDQSQGGDTWVTAVAVTTALLGILVILASACFLFRRAQRKRQQFSKEDAAVCNKDVAPMDAEVKAPSEDEEVLHV